MDIYWDEIMEDQIYTWVEFVDKNHGNTSSKNKNRLPKESEKNNFQVINYM